MEGQGQIILLLPDGTQEQAPARWSFVRYEARLAIDSPFHGSLSGTGHDLLAALAQVRRAVEAAGTRVLCNGSRSDAVVSPMLSQAGGADRVYLLDGVPRGTRAPTAPIFDAAPDDKVGTLEQQEEYRRAYFSRRPDRT